MGGITGPVTVPGPADRKNVEEQILLPHVAAGDYKVTVTAANVPTRDPHFALVAAGGI